MGLVPPYRFKHLKSVGGRCRAHGPKLFLIFPVRLALLPDAKPCRSCNTNGEWASQRDLFSGQKAR